MLPRGLVVQVVGHATVVVAAGRGHEVSDMFRSESANPDSPHHIDQTELFAHGQWVTDRFTEAQIDTDPRLQITDLHG